MTTTAESVLNIVAGKYRGRLAAPGSWVRLSHTRGLHSGYRSWANRLQAHKHDETFHTAPVRSFVVKNGSDTNFASPSLQHLVRWYAQVALKRLGIAQANGQVNINGRMHRALLDNHATGNIMTLEMAIKMDLAIEGDGIPFRMIDNSMELSLGHVWVDCSLASADNMKRRKFHIFVTAVRPLIIGGPFLYETGTLMTPSTAKTENADVDASPQPILLRAEDVHQYSLYLVNVELANLGRSATCLAVADMGADTELMSFSFACKNGFPVQNQQGKQPMIRIGNGKHIRSQGSIQATISLISNQKQLHRPQRCRFIVVENLAYATILSRDFINSQNLLKFPNVPLYHHISAVKHHTCFCICQCPETFLRLFGGKSVENRMPHQNSFTEAEKQERRARALVEKLNNSHRDVERRKLSNQAKKGYVKGKRCLDDASDYGKLIYTCRRIF
jgi:hypothetical protein